MNRLMLLDTASMYFRAFFGAPEILSDDGTNVNAVRGLVGYVADAPVGNGEAAQALRVGRHIGVPIRKVIVP